MQKRNGRLSCCMLLRHTMGHAIHHSIERKKKEGCHIQFNSIVIQSCLLLNQNNHEQTNQTTMTTQSNRPSHQPPPPPPPGNKGGYRSKGMKGKKSTNRNENKMTKEGNKNDMIPSTGYTLHIYYKTQNIQLK